MYYQSYVNLKNVVIMMAWVGLVCACDGRSGVFDASIDLSYWQSNPNPETIGVVHLAVPLVHM